MAYKRKFRPGAPISTLAEAVDLIVGGKWIYFRHKLMHPAWAGSWRLNMIANCVAGGVLFHAIPTEEIPQ